MTSHPRPLHKPFLHPKCPLPFPGEASSHTQEHFLTFQAVAAPSLPPQIAHEPLTPTVPTALAVPSRSLFLDGLGSAPPQAPSLSGCWLPTQGSKSVPQILLVDEAIPVLVHDGEGLAETRALSSHPPICQSPASLPRNNPPSQGIVLLQTAPWLPQCKPLWSPGYAAQHDTSMRVMTNLH